MDGMVLACQGLVVAVKEDLERIGLTREKPAESEELVSSLSKLSSSILKFQDARQDVGKQAGDAPKRSLAETFSNAANELRQARRREPAHGLHQEARARMEFPGSVFTSSEVLDALSRRRKSGTVTILTAEEEFTIQVSDGNVVGAWSSNAPAGTRLGEILVSRGSLSEEELDEFLKSHDSDKCRIGVALADAKLVSEECLHLAIRHQVKLLFRRCLASSPSKIVFEVGMTLPEDQALSMSLGEALVGSGRKQ